MNLKSVKQFVTNGNSKKQLLYHYTIKYNHKKVIKYR